MKANIRKRVFSLLLALVMICSLLPTAALATEGDENGDTTDTQICTCTARCTEEEKDGDCTVCAADFTACAYEVPAVGEEPALCTLTKGCTLKAGHEGECVLPDETEKPAEDTLAEMIAALPNPDEINPEDMKQVKEINEQIAEISAFAEENGIDVEDDETINAVIAALYPAEPLDETSTSGNCGKPTSDDGEVTEAVKWSFDTKAGTLTITGSGAMADYERNGEPWYDLRESITSVVIENGVTGIGNNAFSSCTELKTISLPSGLTSIGTHAFYTCSSLESVSIPVSVTEMGENPFRECKKLTEIILPTGNTYFKKDGNALLTVDGKTLICYPANSEGESYTVPSGVEIIQAGAFQGAKLLSITITNGVTSIGEWAFAASEISSISIPSSVSTIGTYIVRNCPNLTSVAIEGSITSIPTGTFYNCPNLVSITISNMSNVTSIGQWAFFNTGLTTFSIPSSVTSMGWEAFASNKALREVQYGASGTIDGNTFSNCTALEHIKFTNQNSLTIPTGMFRGCTSLKVIDATAFNGTSSINYYAWSGMTSTPILYSQKKLNVNVSDGNKNKVIYAVTNGASIELDQNAIVDAGDGIFVTPTVEDGKYFDGWYASSNYSGTPVTSGTGGNIYYAKYYALSGTADGVVWSYNMDSNTLTISPNSAAAEGVTSGVMSNYTANSPAPWSLFASTAEKVVISDGVSVVGNCAFSNATRLTEVTIPSSVTHIGDKAFENCTSLKKVTSYAAFSSDGTGWLPRSFSGCSNVEIVEFANPNSLYFPAYFFAGMTSLKAVDTTAYTNEIKLNSTNGSYSALTSMSADAVLLSRQAVAFNGNPNLNKHVRAVIEGNVEISIDTTKTGLACIVRDGYGVEWHSDLATGTVLNDLSQATKGTNYYPTWTNSSYSVVDSLSFDSLAYGAAPVSKELTVTANGVEDAAISSVTGSDSFNATSSEMTVTITPKSGLSVGTYSETIIVYTGDGAAHNVAVSLTITKAESSVTPGKDSSSITAAYGDTITLTATTQRATTTGIALMAALDEVEFICGQTSLGTAEVTYDESGMGTATLRYNTSKGGIPVGSTEYITAQYGGSVNLNGSSGNIISVILSPKTLTVTGLTTTNRAYDGTTDVILSGGTLSGKIGNDDVSAVMPTSGTIEDANTGEGKSVTVPTITLSGADASKYTVEQPAVTVNITKATPTISISADRTSPISGGGNVTLTVSGAPTTEGTVSVTCDGVNITDNGDGTFSATLPNETKDYTFTASYTAAENGNYNNAEKATCAVSVTYRSTGGGGGTTTYTVSVDSAKNGSISISPKNASKGSTVTITVKPDSGYELDELTVTDKDGKAIKLTDEGNGRYTFTMPASKVTVEASFAEINEQPGTGFVDVPANAYYADAVAWAVENGVTAGTSATTFSPNASCTRAQMVTFLWRAAGSPAPKGESSPFTDLDTNAYYYDAVLWAIENGITAGTSATTFSPDATVTRGQTVTFLYRTAGSPAVSGSSFDDVSADAYYANAVAWAVREGITNGTGSNTFSPDADCTRGQIVTFLWRDRV